MDQVKRSYPPLCMGCSSRDCEKSKNDDFEVCKYGIAYVNKAGEIIRKEPLLPIHTISKNLRHEINPVLQTIIENVIKLDSKLSTKTIDVQNPLSVIIGATVVLDNFIQMITGVNEFHYSHEPLHVNRKKIQLRKTIDNYFNVYSIIKERERAKNLRLMNTLEVDTTITICSEFINYIIAVLIDNAWKYSTENSVLTVTLSKITYGLATLTFTNHSETMPNNFNLYDLGAKVNAESKGFGFGLYWAKNLEYHYNNLCDIEPESPNAFSIVHEQQVSSNPGLAYQKFILKNIRIDTNEI